jgi:hypothetical protein
MRERERGQCVVWVWVLRVWDGTRKLMGDGERIVD